MPETLYTLQAEQSTDIAVMPASHEPGYAASITQECGRRTSAVMLAGGMVLGLSACEPGSDQTIPIGRAIPEKILSIRGTTITTGLCIEKIQTIYVVDKKKEQKGHNCSPQPWQLKDQNVKQVWEASDGNTHTFHGVSKQRDCESPSVSFIRALKIGDVISKQEENYREYDENNKLVKDVDYCKWQKH